MDPQGSCDGFTFGEGGTMPGHGMLSTSMLQSLDQIIGADSTEYSAAAVSDSMFYGSLQEPVGTAALGGGISCVQRAGHHITQELRNSPSEPNTASVTSSGSAGGPPSRYESQKRRDWNTFGQYLSNHRPPMALSRCSGAHVLEFLRYLDKFGKTKVHATGCPFYGHPQPPAPCACPLRQAWGSLDALIGRLRAAYEEHGGKPESNPFGARAVRLYLREVRETQAKARGIAYEKKKRKRPPPTAPPPVAASCMSSLTPDHSQIRSSPRSPSGIVPATAHDQRSFPSDSNSLPIPSFNG